MGQLWALATEEFVVSCWSLVVGRDCINGIGLAAKQTANDPRRPTNDRPTTNDQRRFTILEGY